MSRNLQRGNDNDVRNYGFAGPRFGWQQSASTREGEILADMFIGWAYGQWQTQGDGRIHPAGQARETFMDSHMKNWIALAINQ